MRNFISFLQQLYQNFLSFWPLRPPNWIKIPLICCFRYIFRSINQFSIELIYFLSVSFIGFVLLKAIKPRTDFQNPSDLDLFFTSVSASTVSSMSTVEMELFSNSQLVVIIILMFIGGEVFTSMVGLHIRAYKLSKSWRSGTRVGSVSTLENSSASTPSAFMNSPINNNQFELHIIPVTRRDTNVSLDSVDYHMRTDSIKFLGYVVLGYLTFFHVLGVTSVFAYINIISSARNVLKSKGINGFTFAVFTVVSTFASCGFLPTNENMVVFGKNSGLLLILIPQVLLGNTLFPSCLRFTLWILGKFVIKSNMESQYLLNNTEQIGYFHLLPKAHSIYLIATVFGFICIQCILIWSMEWNSGALRGLSTYQKLVGVLFQSTNSRHTGETILDISTLSQAILVLLVIMMYLPPYTSFLPVKNGEASQGNQYRSKRRTRFLDNFVFSQLSYLCFFVILVCITERKRLKEDPLNFYVLNITVEVISAYGNVGFSTGYSCKRQLTPDPSCQDKWIGFVGKWSDQGKIILILVMFFGRLKKFNTKGGKAWKLL